MSSALEETFALQLRALKLEGWEREYRFAPPRRFRLDFYHRDRKLAVEIEGGVFTGGRHTRASGFLKDTEKYNLAAEMGITVLRFAAPMVKSGEAIAQVERIIAKQQGEVSKPYDANDVDRGLPALPQSGDGTCKCCKGAGEIEVSNARVNRLAKGESSGTE